MIYNVFIFLIVLLNMFLPVNNITASISIDVKPIATDSSNQNGAYFSGTYLNLFTELLGKSESLVNEKVDLAFNQLFYGDDKTQRVYYPVEPGMAYIKDINYNDVRTEGMSYGMMIAVQLNKKSEFDRLWKWAKTYMQHQSGASKDYFAWHCKTDGSILSENSASDGEEWFVMALFFASARWGNGEGIYNYKAEAQKILDAMNKKTTVEQNLRAVSLCKELGLEIQGSFMIGTPTETMEDIKMTERFIKDNDIKNFQLCIMTAYPGTEVWNYCKENDMIPENLDWSMFNTNTAPFSCNKNFTAEELEDIFNRVHRRLILNKIVRHPLKSLREVTKHPQKIISFYKRMVK